jgi:hypothetical protein
MCSRTLTVLTLIFAAASGLACLGLGKENADDGECSDGVDNDEDGPVDCVDPDCEGAEECHCEYPAYDAFVDDFLLAACGKLQECGLFNDQFTYEDCLALNFESDTGEPWVCQDYDCEVAATCIEQMEAVSCEEYIDGVGYPACEQYCSNL